MPAPGRDRDDELVTAMLAVLKPKVAERAAIARELRRCVEQMRKSAASFGPSSDMVRRQNEVKRQVRRYRTHLLAVKRSLKRYRPEGWGGDEAFLAALDEQIERLNGYFDPGKKPRDLVAEIAVMDAWNLLPRGQRTLTNGGAWHRLSLLLYEAATGKSESGKLLNYMHQMKSPGVYNMWPRSNPHIRIR
jgi:hypothetical protein